MRGSLPMTDPWDDCVFTYIYYKNQPYVSKYIQYMDCMGYNGWFIIPI